MDEVQDNFIIQNKLIFKKYVPIKKIGKGNNGDIYSVKRLSDKTFFALKVEKISSTSNFLESEAYFLFSLQGFGIPKFISYGHNRNYNFLIEELLGKSLNDLFIENKIKSNIIDICLIGIQILDRLEWIHSKNLIYRDIKPNNFLIGIKDPNVIYIIDFGYCKKFKSSKTGKHIVPVNKGKLTGNLLFSSLYTMNGIEASRRDDIISLGYMLIYLLKKNLPWNFKISCLNGDKFFEILNKIRKLKKTNCLGKLFNNLPIEFKEYIKYANNLEFDQDPDYSYLRSLFQSILIKMHLNYRILTFSWIHPDNKLLFGIPRNNSIYKKNSNTRIFTKLLSNAKRNDKRKISIENIKLNTASFSIPPKSQSKDLSLDINRNDIKRFNSNLSIEKKELNINSLVKQRNDNIMRVVKNENFKNVYNNCLTGKNNYPMIFKYKNNNFFKPLNLEAGKTSLNKNKTIIIRQDCSNNRNKGLKKDIMNTNIFPVHLKNNNETKKVKAENNYCMKTNNIIYDEYYKNEYKLNNKMKNYIPKSKFIKCFSLYNIKENINNYGERMKKLNNNNINHINLNNPEINNQIIKNQQKKKFINIDNNRISIKKKIIRNHKSPSPINNLKRMKNIDKNIINSFNLNMNKKKNNNNINKKLIFNSENNNLSNNLDYFENYNNIIFNNEYLSN